MHHSTVERLTLQTVKIHIKIVINVVKHLELTQFAVSPLIFFSTKEGLY